MLVVFLHTGATVSSRKTSITFVSRECIRGVIFGTLIIDHWLQPARQSFDFAVNLARRSSKGMSVFIIRPG
jgi:hypothetical protein